MRSMKFMGASTIALSMLVTGLNAVAQTETADDDDDKTLERVVVTGSFIARDAGTGIGSPVTTVSSADFSAIQAQSIADLTQTLTINTGAQNNPDAFTQGGTTGTANVNLRGLGLQSTLVLLNGKRQVLNGTQTNDGISFVDTNSLVPLIAIDHVDFLTDGAAALYGSDAVAGVANYVTVTGYDGFKFSADYQFHTPSGEGQDEFRFEALYGKTFERGDFLVAASWFDRTALTTEERRFTPLFGPDSSSLGNPGAFVVPPLLGETAALETALGLPAGAFPPFLVDPTGCAEFGGAVAGSPVPTASGFTPGVCLFDFGDFFNLVPDERRFNFYGEFNYDITENISFSVDFSYADLNTQRGNSPTFPFLQPAAVPGTAPTNFFSDFLGTPTDVSFFGRAIGFGGDVSPADFFSNTYRISTRIGGDNFLKNGSWEISYTRAQNDFTNITEDTVTSRFQCALGGAQGTTGINPSTGLAECDAFTGFDGVIPTGEFFNPFATAFTTDPNSAELLDFIIDDQIVDSQSNLDVVEGIFVTEVVDLPAGPLAFAFGGQYRSDRLSRDFDDISNEDGFGFLIGGGDFSGTVDVYAFFGELSIPVTEWFEVQVAGRFEDFGADGGTTLDPKVSVNFTPTDWLNIRGTYSTSFRAPTSFQTLGESTTLNQVEDPNTGGTFFAAVRAFGSELSGIELTPEESRAFTAGFTLEPIDNLVFNFDFYDIDFDDAITQVAFQALVDAFPDDAREFVGGLPTTPCEAEFTIVCRSGDPITGTIIQVNTNFTNAESIATNGIDFGLSYVWDAGNFGTFRPSFNGTYIINYDIVDPTAGAISAAGSRNFSNIGAPTPQLRTNVGLTWTRGSQSLNFFARRIGGLVDDQNSDFDAGDLVFVEDQTRFDLQYGFDISEFLDLNYGAIFSVGVVNLTNADPPFVATNGGFESRVADPRGRLVRFGLDFEF